MIIINKTNSKRADQIIHYLNVEVSDDAETLNNHEDWLLIAPIHYGGLSGQTKLFLESFYNFGHLKKKMVLVLLSDQKGQEGIAVMELLPWCYKHEVVLTDVIVMDKNSNMNKLDHMSFDSGKMMIDFRAFDYLDHKADVPLSYMLRRDI